MTITTSKAKLQPSHGEAQQIKWQTACCTTALVASSQVLRSNTGLSHKYTSFLRVSWTCLKNKATSLRLFKLKQRARPADSAAHPGRASQAVQAGKLAPWQSCTMAATPPENKEEEKLSPPHCQAFYRINYVFHCTSSFCCQPDRETLQFSNLQKRLTPALHCILCDDSSLPAVPQLAGPQTAVQTQE